MYGLTLLIFNTYITPNFLLAVLTNFTSFSCTSKGSSSILFSSLSLSLSLSSKEPIKQKENKTKHVFTKQATRDGLDETVNFQLFNFTLISIKFLSFSNWVTEFDSWFCFWFKKLGWWVITRWKWLTMECKNFMSIFMDPVKVIFLSFIYFFLLNSMILMKEKKKFVFFLLRVFDIWLDFDFLWLWI